MKPNFWILLDIVGASCMTFAAIATSDDKMFSAFWGAQAVWWFCLFIWQVGKCLSEALET